MSDNVIAFLLTLAAGLSTILGSFAVFFLHKFKGSNFRIYIAGFMSSAAGVMVFISFVELVQESIEKFETQYSEKKSKMFAFLFFFGGIILGFLMDVLLTWMSTSHEKFTADMLDQVHGLSNTGIEESLAGDGSPAPETPKIPESKTNLPKPNIDPANLEAAVPPAAGVPIGAGRRSRAKSLDAEEKRHLFKTTVVTGVALGLHNIPEGIATFTAGISNIKLGTTLAIAIALHNIPEGMSVAIPAYYSTNSISRAILYASISGLAEPVGACLAWLFFADSMTDFAYGCAFGLIGGIMVIISFRELLPDAIQFDPKDVAVTKGLVIGMIVVAITIAMI